MRRYAIDSLRPGMKTAKGIINAEGTVLLGEGIVLKENYINRLKELKVPAAYIEDEFTRGVYAEDIISDATRLEAIRVVRDVMLGVKSSLADKKNYRNLMSRGLDAKRIKNIVTKIINEISSRREPILHFVDIRAVDEYIYGHSVDVCVLSILTGLKLEYNRAKLLQLGIGAILHDIGKVKVPDRILNKPGKLVEEEFEEMKKHAWYGYELLKDNEEIGTVAAYVAYQHHERFDGKGYGKGLKADEIHEYARIVGVADVFDALVSDKVYKKGIPHHEAIDYVFRSCNNHFDYKIAEAFLSNIAMYPIGTLVKLSTMEAGVVVGMNKGMGVRPIVRIASNRDGHQIDGILDINLVNYPNVFITDVIQS